MVYVDDELAIETEAWKDVAGPRQRFRKAVRLGIFWYGAAPKDEDQLDDEEARKDAEVPVHERPQQAMPSGSGELWFEGVPKREFTSGCAQCRGSPPYQLAPSTSEGLAPFGHPARRERYHHSGGQRPSLCSLLA